MPAKTKKMSLNVQELMDDPICKKWIFFCLSEDKNAIIDWYKQKNQFWADNGDYLTLKGFTYTENIWHALDTVLVEKIEDMEGCLLIVRIGSEEKPASPAQIEMSHQLLTDALADIGGVRVLLTNHEIEIKKINLPQLRRLQSEVLSSTLPNDNGSTILRDFEL